MRPIHARVGQVARAAVAALERSRQRIDDLNVYPVPDGDTGTNMLQTVQRVISDLQSAPESSDTEALAQRISRAALVGARGNSGVILSQILRGFVTSLGAEKDVDAAALARALRAASDAGYASVKTPVEGTMLTVIREIAEEAEAARGEPIDAVLDRILGRGEDALARTPTMLQALADAGVVDAGGAGIVELVRGSVAGMRGREPSTAHTAESSSPVVHDHNEESRYRYCTGFLLLDPGAGMDVDVLHALFAPLGDSLLVVGDPGAVRVHVHTDDPGAALSIGARHGGLSGIEVSDMQAQVVDRRRRLSEGTPEPGRHRRCDVVTVVQGDGNEALARQRGARGIVPGGQTVNPSTEEILDAIDACAADEVVVLPNNPNVLLAARSAAALAQRPVVVVETRAMTAGLVALDAYSAQHSAEDNAAAMRAAIAATATAEITRASRDAKVEGVAVVAGTWMGLVDNRLVATSPRLSEVAARVAATMITPERQALLVLRGDDSTPRDSVDAAVGAISAAYPSLEIDQHAGGQAHYPLLLAAHPKGRRLDGATTGIVFDSTADITADHVLRPSWRMVPLTVRFGDDEYLDAVDLDGTAFYDRLRRSPDIARTSAPSPGAFEDAYRDLLEHYRDVVSLHISGKLSSTVDSAEAGAATFGPRVHVFDTLAATGQLALAVDGVQRMLDRGTTVNEVEEYVRAVSARGGIVFSADTLEYLQRNGRIGRGRALIGGILRVRPILELVNGEVDAVRRVRGRRAVIPALLDVMLRRSAGFPQIDVVVLHAAWPTEAARLEQAVVTSRPGIVSVRTAEIGAVIGAHVGPGALGICFLAR